jgi:hypothetical protein
MAVLTRRRPQPRWVPAVCIASPLACLALSAAATSFWGYHFGYVLLMLNGLLTFIGLYATSQSTAKPY